MASVSEHYQNVLAEHYTWMFGSFEGMVEAQQHRFTQWQIQPFNTKRALDLGAGSGFQSVALANLGFSVTAIDLSEKLLAELEQHQGTRDITSLVGDLRDVIHLVNERYDVVVCMGDTLPHLPHRDDVPRLFRDIAALLVPGGWFILSFRDLAQEVLGVNRFIPVRSDEHTIMTCFLEYEPDIVQVHDLIYTYHQGQWELYASSYPKLRLALPWVIAQMETAGLQLQTQEAERGMRYLVATQVA